MYRLVVNLLVAPIHLDSECTKDTYTLYICICTQRWTSAFFTQLPEEKI